MLVEVIKDNVGQTGEPSSVTVFGLMSFEIRGIPCPCSAKGQTQLVRGVV